MAETALVKSLSDIERDGDVQSLTKEAASIADRASTLGIYDEASLKAASDLRLEAQRIQKQLEGRRKFFVDPHNQFVKLINGWFKVPGDTISGAIDKLGARMVVYANKLEQEAKEAEQKILADGRTKAETKSERLAHVEQAPKTVRSAVGTTGFRIDKRTEIFNEALLPREYLVPDHQTISKALKEGIEIPGARLIEVKVPTGRSY